MRRCIRRRFTCLLLLMPFAASVLTAPVFYLRAEARERTEQLLQKLEPSLYRYISEPAETDEPHTPSEVYTAKLGAPAAQPLAVGIRTPGEASGGHSEPPKPEAPQPAGAGKRVSLGTFIITAYCACPKCCGKWSGHKMSIPTESGVPYPVEGYTASVDPKVIPLKSAIEIDGLGGRYAHDTGSAIKGKRIDVY
ncbi:MAG: 3D domain-containing protein, partial [Oscillospiraceae bacterium]|nr:3D domain-containing protein [Oscillospiraceae bacterium]